MAKICPITNRKVLYLDCLECDDKVCERKTEPVDNPMIKTPALRYRLKTNPDKPLYITSHCHSDCHCQLMAMDIGPAARVYGGDEEGYLLTDGSFVDRVEGMKIAKARDQLFDIYKDGYTLLYSYMLKRKD